MVRKLSRTRRSSNFSVASEKSPPNFTYRNESELEDQRNNSNACPRRRARRWKPSEESYRVSTVRKSSSQHQSQVPNRKRSSRRSRERGSNSPRVSSQPTAPLNAFFDDEEEIKERDEQNRANVVEYDSRRFYYCKHSYVVLTYRRDSNNGERHQHGGIHRSHSEHQSQHAPHTKQPQHRQRATRRIRRASRAHNNNYHSPQDRKNRLNLVRTFILNRLLFGRFFAQNFAGNRKRTPSQALLGYRPSSELILRSKSLVDLVEKDVCEEPKQNSGQNSDQVSNKEFVKVVEGTLTNELIPNPSTLEQSQMEHRHKIRPVQLFVPSSNNPNILRLNKSALNAVLGHASLANKKVVIISVAGAYRKGKSFLLNFFLEYLYILQYAQKNDVDMDWLQDETELEGFRYRPGAKRDTVGIWIWAEPILIDSPTGERYVVILMDTQGCFEQGSASSASAATNTAANIAGELAIFGGRQMSANSNNNTITIANIGNSSGRSQTSNASNFDGSNYGSANSNTINNNNVANHATLMLSTMLSCVQIYNFADFIPDEAINTLKFFTEFGRLFTSEAPEFGKPFQKLVMLVRDFRASEELAYGFEGGATLLERVLRNATAGDGEALLNMRQHMGQCFHDGISCCLLPHPGPKIADSNTTFRGHVKDIKSLFRDEIRRFVESLISPNLVRPKLINGSPITVRKFIECVREYGRLFEMSDVPTPRAFLNTNIQLSCIDYALDAKIVYCRGMDRVTRSSRMMPEKKLLEAHIKHGIKALNIYDRCPKIDSGDIRNQNLARLQESINHELERYKRMNEEKRVTTCASAMLACGDSPLFGLGLGGAASGAVAASVVTLQLGVVSAGIVAIPVSLTALFGIWMYVTLKPSVRVCLGLERDS